MVIYLKFLSPLYNTVPTETGKPGKRNGHGKVMEYCNQSWSFTRNCTKFGCYLPPLRVHLESLYFVTFSANEKNKKRDSHGKLRNGHGKVMDKYFVKSVGTLVHIPLL